MIIWLAPDDVILAGGQWIIRLERVQHQNDNLRGAAREERLTERQSRVRVRITVYNIICVKQVREDAGW